MSSTLENNSVKRAPVQPLAAWLHELGLANLAAGLLEAAGPLNAVLAQLLYLGQPLLSPWLSGHRLEALAQALEEDPAALARQLRSAPEEAP